MELRLKTNKRVSFYIRRMKSAMPEILRQIEVYENTQKSSGRVKSSSNLKNV